MSSGLPILGRNNFTTLAEPCVAMMASDSGAVLLLDKPYGQTSFYVVNRIRKELSRFLGLRKVKVGHAGTLDPLATGLLLIATRGATKQIESLMGLNKTYQVTARLGIRSASYDLEQPIEIVGDPASVLPEAIEECLLTFLGTQEQIPPSFSAIKRAGRPVYHLARKGEHVELAARTVTIYSLDSISISLPVVSFRVVCSKGTYVRSLVRDLGEKLGVGAVMTDLRREGIGEWNVDEAVTPDEFSTIIRDARIEQIAE